MTTAPEQNDFYCVYNNQTLSELADWLRTVSYNAVREQVRDKKDRLCITLIMDYDPANNYSKRQQRAGFIMCSHPKLHARAIRLARKLQIGEGNRTPRKQPSAPPEIVYIRNRRYKNDQ